MLRFQICHIQKDPKNPSTEVPVGPGPLLLFETCLRKIWIAPESSMQGPGLLKGEEAYAFLLEIICGMGSPIFGETEILGQFRQFLKNLKHDPTAIFFQSWSQQLLEDAKTVRTQHLQGQGQHSYGSLLRKTLAKGERLWILGAGNLTEAMLPWLADQNVTLWVRRPDDVKTKFPESTVMGLDQTPPADATIIVAATLTEEELAPYLQRARGSWIDLREKNVSVNLRAPRITLSDLYKEIALSEAGKAALRARIIGQIQDIASTRLDRAWFRPQGWEDMCAS